MRPLSLLFALALLCPIASAQTAVDLLASQLDLLSKGTIDRWRHSTDFSGDPVRPEFNDATWKPLQLNQSIYVDSCWIRTEVIIPERMMGERVSGPIKFLVSVDDYGFLWVNGQSRGHFPWDGEFELTGDAKPGDKFLLAIKAINTGGPLRLIRAQIVTGRESPFARSVEDFTLGIRVAQKLLSFDTYQTNATRKQDPGTDRSAMDRGEKQRLNELLQSVAAGMNVDALRQGNVQAFRTALENAQKRLVPVAEYVKRFTLYFDSNAHIDAAWLWRERETIMVCRNTFASVIRMMEERPDFTYTQSSAAYYDWMQRLYPDLFRQIAGRVKDGRWEIVGGMWVEPDCNLPSGESWARQLLYAKRYFRSTLGTDVKIGWNPDSFGYNMNMPAFYANAGIDAFITQKIGWNDTNVFPYRLFWWESPDGSRILSYFPFDYVNTIDDPFRLVDWLRQFEANTGFTKMMILFGVGDHGGGPSLAMLDRIDRLKTVDLYPRIEYGTATKYLDWLRSHDLAPLPVWKSELYLEYHQGTFTTQAAMKAFNRSNEVLLTNAEKASSFASLYGRRYNSPALADAWKKLLFNQFHDILPGSSIREVYIDATESHREAAAIGSSELASALDRLVSQVNTSSLRDGIPFIVFNSLSWERTDLAEVRLPEGDMSPYAVFTSKGKEVTSQTVQLSRYDRRLVFIAEKVPQFGYSTYALRKRAPAAMTSSLRVSPYALENNHFGIAIDSATGWVRSIVDRRNGREILAGNGNELQLLEDRPKAWDAWNIGLTGTQYPTSFRKAEVLEAGPVRSVIRLHRDYLKPGTKKDFPTEDFPTSFFTQDVILYDGLDRIDFALDADWWEEKTMAKVAFPLAFTDTAATYEVPYGSIRRSTLTRNSAETAQVEVPAERWADVSAGEYGVSLLNRAKYGYDIKGNTMRLSLLRSPKWPDPTADRGRHQIAYALYPHTGDWRAGGTVRRGYEFNTPLIIRMTSRHNGQLPERKSFVSVSPANLILTSIKQAEEKNAWVLQWYDAEGRASTARVELPAAPKRALLSNFIEDDGSPVTVEGKTITFPTRAHGIVTVKVFW